jgi:hypothetical protein
MDFTPLILILGSAFFIVSVVYMIERCPHKWEIVQEGNDPDGKKYQIIRCKMCNQFQKINDKDKNNYSNN